MATPVRLRSEPPPTRGPGQAATPPPTQTVSYPLYRSPLQPENADKHHISTHPHSLPDEPPQLPSRIVRHAGNDFQHAPFAASPGTLACTHLTIRATTPHPTAQAFPDIAPPSHRRHIPAGPAVSQHTAPSPLSLRRLGSGAGWTHTQSQTLLDASPAYKLMLTVKMPHWVPFIPVTAHLRQRRLYDIRHALQMVDPYRTVASINYWRC